MAEDKQTSGMIYEIDDIPPTAQGLFLGLQHYLTMLGSTVAIPIVLSGAFGLNPNDPEDFSKIASLMATMFGVQSP